MNARAFAVALSGAAYRGTLAGVDPDDMTVAVKDDRTIDTGLAADITGIYFDIDACTIVIDTTRT